MTVSLNPTITLDDHRCYDCGRYWAAERGVDAQCPHCAAEKVRIVIAEQTRLERSNAALRGAIARSRKKRG